MTCKTCLADFPATTEFFYRDRATLRLSCKRCTLAAEHERYKLDPSKKIEVSRRWRVANHERAKANSKRAYYANRAERLAAERERYRSDPQVRARKIAHAKQWAQDNAERTRALKRESEARHPETKRNSKMARRARERKAMVERVDVLQVLESFGHRCFYCLKKLGKNFHIDHKTPLSKGGLHCYANVVPSCPKCNVRKSAKTAESYLAALGRLPLA